ncbi:putative reverse transcriptase domain-containing protein [Tanacetum coccineum]
MFKSKNFNWDEEQELAFQILKDKLCNAPVLALPDGPEGFVVYCDVSGIGLGCVLMQRGLESLSVWTKECHLMTIRVVSHIPLVRKELNSADSGDGKGAADEFAVSIAISLDEMIKRGEGCDALCTTGLNHEEMIRCIMIEDRLRLSIKGPLALLQKPEILQCKEAIRDFLDMSRLSPRPMVRRSWDVHLPLVEFSYNNSYHSSVRCALFEELYGKKCRSPIMWAEVGEGQLIGPKLVQETTEKISQIKDRLKVHVIVKS